MSEEQTEQSQEPVEEKEAVATASETEAPSEGSLLSSEEKAEAPIELKLPEGSLLDASRVDEIVAFAKEHGLSQKQAQSILDRDSNAAKVLEDSYKKREQESVDSISKQWAEEAAKDSEIGGEKLAENVELSKRVINAYGSKEFVEYLKGPMGNNKEVIRFLAKIGRKLVAEDKLVLGGASEQKRPRQAHEYLYGEDK